MKYSKFTALLLVIAFAFGSISQAFAIENTELHGYPNNGKEATKAGATTLITGLAATVSTETALTTVGTGLATGIATVTGVAVSPVAVGAVIVAGTAAITVYAVNRLIDWW